MSDYLITIDAGTTNTRAFLWTADRHLVGAEKRKVGVRNTAIDGSNDKLRTAVRECLDSLLSNAGLAWGDVRQVLASGMITSNVGLYELSHLTVPVSLDDLANGVCTVEFKELCPLPITFIPGVKNHTSRVTTDNFESMDIMRGEEVETFALLESLDVGGGWLIVLPGSHTKFVTVDDQRRITGCLTSITGELLDAVTKHTVLSDAVGRRFIDDLDYSPEWTLRGCSTAARVGLGRACFSARVLSQFAGEPPEHLANFLAGACLQSDVDAVRNSHVLRIATLKGALIAGSGALCRAMTDVLRQSGLFPQVRTYMPRPDTPLSGLGALAVAECMYHKSVSISTSNQSFC